MPFNSSATVSSKSYADIVKNGTGPDNGGIPTVNYFRLLISSSISMNVNIDNIKIVGIKSTSLISTPVITLRTTNMNQYRKIVTVCSVTDFGAIGNGLIDDTSSFQQSLDYAESLGGGSIWVPAGKFVITNELRIPTSVYLIGQWSDPDANPSQISTGSVLLAETGRNETYGAPFLSIGAGAGIIGLTVFYPDQSVSSPVFYPPTVKSTDCSSGLSGFPAIRYCTLINPYTGISFGYDWNELGIIDHVYMSPLKKGVYVNQSTDVSRINDLFIASKYWKLYDSAIDQNTLKTTMKNQTIGIELQRTDWQYIFNYSAQDVNTGLLFTQQAYVTSALVDSSNSQMYNLNMSNVVYGIDFNYNRMSHHFTKLNISADTNCIKIRSGFSGSAAFNGATFNSLNSSNVYIDGSAKGIISILDSTFNSWPAGNYGICAYGGAVLVQSCVSNGIGTYDVFLGTGTSAGTFDYNQNISITKDSSVTNYSALTNAYTANNYYNNAPDLGTCPYPTGNGFANVLSYGADKTAVSDSTTAFTNAMNYVSAQGGGIVYVPAGKYWIGSTLSIPSGVELRGVSEAGHTTGAMGSVLLSTNTLSTPFITLQSGSGLRGVNIWYPNQTMINPIVYPYTIKNNGQNVWVVNVNIGNGYRGLDLSINSGGHYVEYLTGFNHMNDITVDNSTTTGRLINCHFNPTFLARTDPLKLQNGGDPNSQWISFLTQIDSNKDGSVVLGKTTTEQGYGVFNYRAKTGLKLITGNGGNFDGLLFGFGFDGSGKGAVITATSTNYAQLINCNIDLVPNSPNYLVVNGGLVRAVNCGFGAFNFTPSDGIYITAGTLELRQPTLNASATNGGLRLNGSTSSVVMNGGIFMHRGASSGNIFTDQTNTQVVDISKASGTLTLGCNISRKFWKYSPTSLPGTSRHVKSDY